MNKKNCLLSITNLFFLSNGKKQVEANPFDDHDEEWDENDNSENVLTDNGNDI